MFAYFVPTPTFCFLSCKANAFIIMLSIFLFPFIVFDSFQIPL